MPRIDFYVSDEPGADVRLRLACRVAEKAYLAKQKVVVWLDDADSLQALRRTAVDLRRWQFRAA